MGRPRKGQPPAGQRVHGTAGGYVMHGQYGTPPCAACVSANSARRRKYYARGKCERGLGWPLLPGGEPQ